MIEGFLTYLRSEKRYSELTVRAYGDDIRQFVLFCCGVTAPPTPEEEADILRSFDPTLSEGNDLRGWIMHLTGDQKSQRPERKPQNLFGQIFVPLPAQKRNCRG